MKVMLIQLPMIHLQMNIAPNIGLAYIAAVLEEDDILDEKTNQIFTDFWVGTYVWPSVFLKQLQLFFSRNRFRRAMAKQYVKMAWEMIFDVKKMKNGKNEGF